MEQILPFLILGGLMYALLIFPQQRRNRAHQQLLSSLSEGDEILTSSGIFGFVKEVENDVLWIEVSPNTELRIAKSAVSSKVNAPADKTDGDEDEDE